MAAEHSHAAARLCQRTMYGIEKKTRTGGAKEQGEDRYQSDFRKIGDQNRTESHGKSPSGDQMKVKHRYIRHH